MSTFVAFSIYDHEEFSKAVGILREKDPYLSRTYSNRDLLELLMLCYLDRVVCAFLTDRASMKYYHIPDYFRLQLHQAVNVIKDDVSYLKIAACTGGTKKITDVRYLHGLTYGVRYYE